MVSLATRRGARRLSGAILATSALWASSLYGQESVSVATPASVTTVPEAVQQTVLTQVAQAWGVPEGDVVVDWGRLPSGRPVRDDVAVDLVGSGHAGNWIVQLDEGRDRFGVRVRAGVRRIQFFAARPVSQGATVQRADVQSREAVEWGPPRAELPDPVGMVARVPVDSGDALKAPALRAPVAVQAGSQVRVLVLQGAVRLEVTGIATGSASAGESVAVRLETGRRVRGTATAEGYVRIDSSFSSGVEHP